MQPCNEAGDGKNNSGGTNRIKQIHAHTLAGYHVCGSE